MHFQSITYHARNFFLKMRCWNDRDPVLLTVAGGTRFKASFPAARLATYMRVTKLCFVNIWITRKTKACHCAQPVPSFLSLFFLRGGVLGIELMTLHSPSRHLCHWAEPQHSPPFQPLVLHSQAATCARLGQSYPNKQTV